MTRDILLSGPERITGFDPGLVERLRSTIGKGRAAPAYAAIAAEIITERSSA